MMAIFIALTMGIAFAYLALISNRYGSVASKVVMLVAIINTIYFSSQLPVIGNILPPSLTSIINNITLFISLPLIMLIIAHHYFGERYLHGPWQAATWGRIFLALTVVFELTRRNQLSLDYLTYLHYGWVVLAISCWWLFRHIHTSWQKAFWAGAIALAIVLYFAPTDYTFVEFSRSIQVGGLVVLLSLFWRRQTNEDK